ncbi:MAG: Fur family transcriptional regulator [Rickettsiaceae bacterium]|jgi:Fur family ferric uptake transcriptional regulator|nr:Fur family transcriptional regulator [Rickettsiaceae bacterium]
MLSQVEKLCLDKKIKLTANRRIVARVISESHDHPDVEELYKRASKIKSDIGIATVYRAVKMFEEEGVITRHDFGKGRYKARYEELNDHHHDHLIDVNSGKVIEFFNEEIEKLKEKIAKDLGYKLVDHKLELYAVPIKSTSK